MIFEIVYGKKLFIDHTIEILRKLIEFSAPALPGSKTDRHVNICPAMRYLFYAIHNGFYYK